MKGYKGKKIFTGALKTLENHNGIFELENLKKLKFWSFLAVFNHFSTINRVRAQLFVKLTLETPVGGRKRTSGHIYPQFDTFGPKVGLLEAKLEQ